MEPLTGHELDIIITTIGYTKKRFCEDISRLAGVPFYTSRLSRIIASPAPVSSPLAAYVRLMLTLRDMGISPEDIT